MPVPENLRLRECRHGLMLYHALDFYIGGAFERYGEFSEGERDVLKNFVKEGDTVVEVGANIGSHTVWLAQRIAPTGVLYAFEPQRLVFQNLCANLALNGIANVVAFPAAVGEKPDVLYFPITETNGRHNAGGVSMQEKPLTHVPTEAVPCNHLDALGLAELQLLKIDVEGMEANVLRGARDTIARCRPVLYVENDRKEKSPELIRLLESLDYQLYWHLPPLYSAQNFRNNPVDEHHVYSSNILGLAKEKACVLSWLEPVQGPDDWKLSG